METIYELNEIISKLEDTEDNNAYFVDFLKTEFIQAGILRLRKDQPDTQSSHPVDEIYYVIEGEGFIRINRKQHKAKKGTSIFVPANVEHNFYGNKADLIVFYVLAGK